MNILEICDDYPPFATGGIGNTIVALVQEWKRIGVNVNVLCVGAGKTASIESDGGLTLTRVPRPEFPPRTLWFQLKSLPLIRRCLANADIVHAQSSACALLASAGREPKRPWVVTVHQMLRRAFPIYFWRPIAGRVFRDDLAYTFGFPYTESLFRKEQSLADHLAYVSRHMLHDSYRMYGADVARKSSSIWAPVGTGGFAHTNSKQPTERFTYAAIGRLYWHKGQTFLLKAFNQLAKRHNGVALRLYGGLTGGPLEGGMRRRVKELGLEDCVEFRGFMDHEAMLSEISSEVDVVVHPALYEGCPIALLEAMSLGKPIVVSDLPWSQEFIQDGVTGLRSQLDAASLSSRMERLQEDGALRAELGANARAFVRSNFHPEVIAKEYLSLFESLVAS